MIEQNKLKILDAILQKNRELNFETLKQFLVKFNPNLETAQAMLEVITNFSILEEMDCHQFLEKWMEYVRCREKSQREIYKASVNTQFKALMEKNFKGAGPAGTGTES